jgi:hypothetical protein
MSFFLPKPCGSGWLQEEQTVPAPEKREEVVLYFKQEQPANVWIRKRKMYQ